MLVLTVGGGMAIGWNYLSVFNTVRSPVQMPAQSYEPRVPADISGYIRLQGSVTPWDADSSLQEIGDIFHGLAKRKIQDLDRSLNDSSLSEQARAKILYAKVSFLNSDGEPQQAYKVLE